MSRRDRDDDRRDRDREDDGRDRDDEDEARIEVDDGFGFAPEEDADDRGGDLADETVALLDGERPLGSRRAAAATRKTMLRVAGGGYVTSRSLGVVDAGGGAGSASDGGHPTLGLHLRAEVFPFGETGAGRRLTGLGFRIDMARAIGNKVAAQVDGAVTQLDVDQTAWSAAAAYRRPLEPVILQLDAGYGSTSQSIVDKPMSVAVVDASYGYVRAGGRVEVPVAARATVGAGAHYLYLTSAPEMQKLGAPSATGFDADASLEVALTPSLTAIGAIDYQRISLTFGAGSSTSAATDSFLSARLALGLSY